jgi:rhodanese-related sulfurtransferase
MMKKLLSSILLSAALIPGAALACDGDKAKIQTVSTAEGAKLAQAKAATFVDVNGTETRTKQGIIPGAVLLTSTEFKADELPANKASRLVFYCANTQCGASKMAAKKAINDGYGDVWVLPEGIMGWKQAGNETAPYAAAKTAAKTQS